MTSHRILIPRSWKALQRMNTGAAMGYNARCGAQALDSTGKIVDVGMAFFAGLGNIDVGKSASDEAVFFKRTSHTGYATVEYDCTWLTRN